MRLFELLDDVWRSTVALCEDLAPEEWEVETDCPGWTVKDVVSHLAGTESWLLGRAPPDHDPGSRDYVRNDLGRANEVFVDFRRSWPPRRVLDEFKEVTSERLAVLGAWGEDDLEAGSWTPFGPGTARQLLEARVADGWIHEQDVRRAVGRPGHQDGPVAGFVLRGLVRNGLGYAVAKKAGCPDGTTVQFEVTGPKPLDATVFVAGGRGRASEGRIDDATVRLAMDQDAFVRMACGRGAPNELIAAGRVSFHGDRELGERIARHLNFLF